MAAIWQRDAAGWRLLAPVGFPDEQQLHTLVEEAPQLLPLAGAPRLVVVGREVLLGGNYADLLAVEPSGRLAIIEVKLARNAEARRAVVAQVLTYAAYLRGLTPSDLERDILAAHLRQRGFDSLEAAAASDDQEGSFDPTAFACGLNDSLASGRFRLVLVLDAAPAELVRLVGYLESVANLLLIDLITVAAYEVGGTTVLVPQRVDAGSSQASPPPAATQRVPTSAGERRVDGAQDFVDAIAHARPEYQELLQRLADWALALEKEGCVSLETCRGVHDRRFTLLPRLPGDNVGLVTIWNDNGAAYLELWRSVFERRAPGHIASVEQIIAPVRIGQGNSLKQIDDALLDALTAAYREAAGGRITD